MNDSDPIVSAVDVSAGYPNNPLWSGANFSIRRGEFVAVLGPNGAGKTTLFRLLLGLTQPLKGDLSIFGARAERGNHRIGYVPQQHPIDSEMGIEVLELVRLGLDGTQWGFRASNKNRAVAREALRLVDAEALAHKPLGVLSGGELQRVFLAEALVGEPDLLLLDEPLSNLDIRREANLVQLIESVVRARDISVLLIAHNVNPLLPVVDRILYVANGQIATGTPHDVLTSESLSALYGTPIEVLRDSRGRLAIIGAEEPEHHHG